MITLRQKINRVIHSLEFKAYQLAMMSKETTQETIKYFKEKFGDL